MKGVADRRPVFRPYLFEIVALANLLVIDGLSPRHVALRSFPTACLSTIPSLAGYVVVGVIIRGLIAWRRNEIAAFRRRIATPGWLTDTLRLVIAGAVMMHAYFWIKLLIPLLHPRLYDQELWDLDRVIGFGLSPNIFFLTLFSNPLAMRAIDWSYAFVFFASLTIAFTFFLSEPSRRLRIAFAEGNTWLWLIGAWLYMALPSLGPAYRFPDVWFAYTELLPRTQHFQALLMRNYNRVLRAQGGLIEAISLMFGIAAFPSLHVAFQTYVVLWMRRLWIYGGIVFGVFLVTIFIGSVVTGWHYLIDSIAGLVLAALMYLVAAWRWKIKRWLDVRSVLNGDDQ